MAEPLFLVFLVCTLSFGTAGIMSARKAKRREIQGWYNRAAYHRSRARRLRRIAVAFLFATIIAAILAAK